MKIRLLILLCVLFAAVPAFAVDLTASSFGAMSTAGGKLKASKPGDTFNFDFSGATVTKSGKSINVTIPQIAGPAGPTGPEGPPGATGPTGPQGVQGNPGLSLNWRGDWQGSPTGYVKDDAIYRLGASYRAVAFSSNVDPSTDLLYQYWFPVAMKGSTGATGPQGPAGATGPQGPKGDTGATGATGPQGVQGVQGPQGPAGATGATGATGSTGPQGPQGVKGDKGDTGTGVIAGGSTGQSLTKNSPTDYDMVWGGPFKSLTAFDDYSTAKGIQDAAQDAEIATKASTSSLGTAAYTASSSYATAAQGSKADTALQPGDVDNEVYTSDYNGGVLSHVAINQAITDIGSAVKTLVVTPGTYPMSNHVTVPVNITLRVQPGAIIDHTAGVLTINGPLDAPGQMWLDNFEYPNLVFGDRITDAYVDWVDAAGDGTTDDKVPLRALLEACAHMDVYANGSKTYNLPTGLTVGYPTALKLHGNGAVLKSAVTDGNTLSIGGWAASYTGQSIAVTAGSSTFTVPGGVTVTAGDMIRLTAGTEYVPGYKRGVLTNVVSVSGNTATIDFLPVVDFTATDVVVYTRTDNVEVEGFQIDNTGSTENTNGIVVQGRGAWVHDNIATGSQYAAIGVQTLGIGNKIEANDISDYLSKSSTDGGRYGDGIGISGHNNEVLHNTIDDCKHGITVSVREFASNTTTIRGNSLSQTPSRFGETFVQAGNTKYLYSGLVDVHGDAENVVIDNNELDGAGFALFTIRNGRAVITNNRGRLWNNTATGTGIINIGEESLRSMVLTGNDFAAETASTPLMSAADGSWLQQIAVASPVYTNGEAIDVKQDGTNTFANILTTYAYPTLAADTLPVPCQPGQIAMDTNATTGKRIYGCEAGGVWALQGDGDTVYSLPTASAGTLGGVKVGDRLSITGGILSADVQTGTVMTVREEDGSPTGTPSTLKFSNGSVTDNGDGSFSITNPGGTTDHATLSNLSYAAAGHTGFEPTITAGTTAQYLRGDKSLATLNQAAVAGLTTTSSPTFTAATLSASDTSGTYLTIENTSSTSAKFMNMKMANYGGTVGGFPSYRSLNARGAKGSPTATLANDATLTFLAYGYGATGEKTSGSFKFNPEGNFSDADQPTAFIVELGKVGGSSALTERLKIETAGAISIPANGSATGGTDRLKLWNVEGDYIHILDEDSNEARLGQKTLSLGAASGGTATIESTSHATKGLLTIANPVSVTGNATATTFTGTIPAATTYGATTTIDLSLGDSPSVTLTGSTTFAFTNPVAGQWHLLEVIQDATGGRQSTWPSSGLICTWRNADGTTTEPTQVTTASSHSFYLIHTKSTTAADCFAR